jgi:hypothetical protein
MAVAVASHHVAAVRSNRTAHKIGEESNMNVATAWIV